MLLIHLLIVLYYCNLKKTLFSYININVYFSSKYLAFPSSFIGKNAAQSI